MRDDDELLRQYLLGELDTEEEDRLEARLIQDGGLFERAEAVEADLLVEHAHGGLSAAQRERLERHLASSPAARSQLAMVRALGKAAEEEKPGRRVLTGPWGRTDLSRASVRTLAAAAMLALAVSSVWLALQTSPLPREAEPVIAEVPAPAPPPVRPSAPPVETPSVPDRIAHTQPVPEPAPPVPRAVVSQLFELGLTALRGPEGPEELRIAPATERVDFQLPLSPGDESYASYQAAIRDTATGTEVIRREGLHPVRSGEKTVLLLPVEAELLQVGLYEVDVKGIPAEGEPEDLGFPQFEVKPEMNPPG